MLLTKPGQAEAHLSEPELVKINCGWVTDLLWGSMACLALLSLLSLGSLYLLRQAGWWRNHTHEAIEQIDSLEQALTRSSMAERAYQAEHRPQDLMSFRLQMLESDKRLAKLARTTLDNPQQQIAVRGLRRLLAKPVDAPETAERSVQLLEIWPALDGMRQEEMSLLRTRSARMERIRSTTLYLSGGLFLISVVSLLVFRAKWKRENIWTRAVLRRLSGAERRFHAFMDNSPLLAFIKDANSQVVYFNHAWQSFLGPEPQPGTGSFFCEEVDQRLQAQDQDVLTSGKPKQFLEKVTARDQTIHDWLIVKFPFSTDDGTMLLGGLALDVTETRRAQEALETSEKRLQLALQSAAMQVWEYDVESDRLESFFADFDLPGTTTSQLLRLEEALERVSPAHRDRVREQLHAAIVNQSPFSETYQTTNGRWIVSSGQVQGGDTSRASLCVVGVGQDQTERIEAEQQFAKLTELHDSILRSTHIALISIGLDRVVTSWNPAAERLLGYTAEEVVGRATPDLWQDETGTRLCDAQAAGEGRSYFEAFLDRVVKTSEEVREWTFIRKDRSKVPVRLTVTAILDEKGQLAGFLGNATDLSELKNADHRAEELNHALQNTLSGWAQLDLEGRFVRANRSFAGTAGYTPDELAGLAWETTIHPGDGSVFSEALGNISLQGRSELRVRGLRKDGSVFYPQLFLAASNDYQGNRNGSYCFMRDHTPQVEAERRLITSERKYRQLFELNPLPCWIYNPKTLEVVDVNEAAIRHYGYSRDRFLAMTLCDIRVENEAVRMDRELASLSTNLAPTSGPWHNRLENGSLIDVELAARDLSETARLVVVRDVTEERRAQLALRRSESLLQEAQCIARVGSWELNTRSGVVTWGPEMCRIFGFEGTPNGTSYERFLDTIHPGDRTAVVCAINESIEKKQKYDLEYRVVRTDGSVRFVQGRGQYTNGSTNCLTGTVLDITEQKQFQDQLEQSLREKEVLLQEIHHRVKNNLQVISCLLNMQAGKLDDEPAVGALQESERRVMAMALIHERLYNNTRMDRINFRDYAQTLVEDLISSYSATSSQIAGVFDLEAIELSIEQAIPCGLILNELVTNVLKYAYPKGAAGEVIVTLKEDAAAGVILTVADRGKGLPEQFDPKKSKSLGLTIVHLLSKQLGGTLQIRPADPGSSFSISFPKVS